jgi:hypothetical protein
MGKWLIGGILVTSGILDLIMKLWNASLYEPGAARKRRRIAGDPRARKTGSVP